MESEMITGMFQLGLSDLKAKMGATLCSSGCCASGTCDVLITHSSDSDMIEPLFDTLSFNDLQQTLMGLAA